MGIEELLNVITKEIGVPSVFVVAWLYTLKRLWEVENKFQQYLMEQNKTLQAQSSRRYRLHSLEDTAIPEAPRIPEK